jgi:hypothetical protein
MGCMVFERWSKSRAATLAKADNACMCCVGIMASNLLAEFCSHIFSWCVSLTHHEISPLL